MGRGKISLGWAARSRKLRARMKTRVAFAKQHILPALVFFGVAWLLSLANWMQGIENQTLDLRTKLRASYQSPVDPRLVVAGIDDDSIERLGRWPWSRQVHGQMMILAAQAGVAVVTWDILFSEPDVENPQNDLKLLRGAKAAQSAGTEGIFGAATAERGENLGPESKSPLTRPLDRIEGDIKRIPGDDGMLLPFTGLQESAHFAFVDTPPEFDGVRRFVPLLARVDNRVFTSLSLETMLRFWKVPASGVRVKLGDAIYVQTPDGERRIPIDEGGRYFINFRFGTRQANIHGFAQLLIRLTEFFVEEKKETSVADLKGKIFLVGQIATALTDNGPTPFSPHTPLVLVHANAIDNFLRGDFPRRVPDSLVLLGGIAIGLSGSIALRSRKFGLRGVFGLGMPLIYGAVATWSWIAFSNWLPIVWPVLGFAALQVYEIVGRLLAEQRAKEQIKGMFGTYVSPALVNRMVESGESPQLGGHEDEITAYFSDIQGFSTFSEKLPPDRLVELMNEYLTACTDIVQEEGGTLDKYIGDAVVAMFGAPIALPDHAFRACVATQRVQKKLGELRVKWQSEGGKWPEIVWRMQSRIGLNSGRCIIGNMGSRTRFNYTMMGDNVNLAARMESGAKTWGVYSMCAEATKLACEEHGGDRVIFRALGKILVLGRSRPVPFYEIVGLKEDVTPRTLECIALFGEGMAKYFARDWDGAIEVFSRSQILEPNVPGVTPGVTSNPSLIFSELARQSKLRPPPEGWDGVHIMKEK